jgi:hypothetical protein
MCALSNAFGATRKTPCVNVDDGGLYQAPPPTAEQQRLTQEENERQRQAQLAQEKAQLQQWETEVVGCLAHATVNIYSVTDEPRLCMNRPDEPLNLPQPDDWPQPMKDALARCLGQYQRVVRHEAFPGAFMRMCTSVN